MDEIDLSDLPWADGAAFEEQFDKYDMHCLQGTRTDLLQKVSDWAEDSGGELIFWLNGKAGTGKSTIARTVAKSLADKGQLAASFFFKRGEAYRGDPSRLFTTIAGQLALKFHTLAPHISDAVDSDRRISKKPSAQQFEKLILHPLSQAKSSLSTSPNIIVIDALDECEQEIPLILRLLTRVKEVELLTLRFFVTSRPEPPLRFGFKAMRGGIYKDLILEDVAPSLVKHDITVFLEHEFAKIRNKYNHEPPLPADWPSPQNIQTLVSTAFPLFISAATMCLFIKDRRFDPRNRLEKVLMYQFSSHTTKFDKTYLPVLDQLLVNLDETEKMSLLSDFKLIVGSIILFTHPLSKTSIAKLLGIAESTVSHILDWLHSVLNVPSDMESPVQLLHGSFRDFLINPEKRESLFWIDKKAQHSLLAVKCLELLQHSGHLKTDVCDLESPGMRRSDIDSQTIASFLPPEVQYACCYWVYHLKESGDRVGDTGQVGPFLEKNFLHWVEALCLLGRISDAVTMILDLQELIECDASPNLANFLSDARRFILRNRTVIDDAPLQIYSSALVFAPENSVIKYYYRDEIPSWIQPCPDMEPRWGSALQTLEADFVTMLQFSEGSKLLTAISPISTAKSWNPVTGALLQSLGTVMSEFVSLSPDHRLLATASGQAVDVWDIAAGKRLHRLSDYPDSPLGAAFSPNCKVLAVRWKGSVTVCDLQDSCKLRQLNFRATTSYLAQRFWRTEPGIDQDNKLHSGPPVIKFSSDGDFLATEGEGTITVWDMPTGKSHRRLGNALLRAESFVFSTDSKFLAATCTDGIRIWDPATGALVQCLNTPWSACRGFQISPDGKRLALASNNNTVSLWHIPTGQLLQSRDDGNFVFIYDPSPALAFSENNLLAFPSRNPVISGTLIKIIDCISGDVLSESEGHAEPVTSVVFSGDGKLLASASRDGTVRTHDVTPSSLRQRNAGAGVVTNVALSGDGKSLGTVSRSVSHQTITVCNLTTGGVRTHDLSDIKDELYITTIGLSRDGMFVGLGLSCGTVWLWDLARGEMPELVGPNKIQPTELEPYGAQLARKRAHRIVFSKSCKLLAEVSLLGVILWDLTTRKYLDFRSSKIRETSALAFSDDDRLLAVDESSTSGGVESRVIVVYSTATGEAYPPNKQRPEGLIKDLAFSANGRYLVYRYSCIAVLRDLWDKTGQQVVQHMDGRCSLYNDDTEIQTPLDAHTLESYAVLAPELQHFVSRLVCSAGWIIRDKERLLRIPPDYARRDDDFTVYPPGKVFFGNNTFAWISPHGFPIVIGFKCE